MAARRLLTSRHATLTVLACQNLRFDYRGEDHPEAHNCELEYLNNYKYKPLGELSSSPFLFVNSRKK